MLNCGTDALLLYTINICSRHHPRKMWIFRKAFETLAASGCENRNRLSFDVDLLDHLVGTTMKVSSISQL